MPDTLSLNPSRAMDLNGFSVSGARAYFFDSGTDSARVVYADADGKVPHPVPLLANGAGVFPVVYDLGSGEVKLTVTDADGVVLPGFPLDPASRSRIGVTGASGVSFSPTGKIPELDVQSAIERVDENIDQAIRKFGIGITNNAPLISNLDATTTASGIYRFDGTTGGTFPTGLTAANTGLVFIWRQSSGRFIQFISNVAGSILHYRSREGVFEGWRRIITNTDTVSNVVWRTGTSNEPAIPTPANIAAVVRDDRVWQDVTATRAAATTYQNTTNRTIQVMLHIGVNSSGSVLVGPTSGALVMLYESFDWDAWPATFDVPPGHFYRLASGSAPNRWVELR